MVAICEKEKVNCRTKVISAIRQGDMIRPVVCDECEQTSKTIDAHHDDYNKPLEVRWLCRSCHQKHHRKMRAYEYKKDTYEQRTVAIKGRPCPLPVLDASVCESNGLALDETVPDKHEYFSEIYDWDLILSRLLPQEEKIIRLLYGIGGGRVLTNKQLGTRFRITQQGASARKQVAIRKLRKMLTVN